LIGPTAFDRLPLRAAILIRPLFAESGTDAMKTPRLRSGAETVGDAPFAIRQRGNSTIPARRFRPRKRSVPPGEATCGWLPHASAGQHLTEVTCGTRKWRRAKTEEAGVTENARAASAQSRRMLRFGDRQVVSTNSSFVGLRG
jgi:hypothetical protein